MNFRSEYLKITAPNTSGKRAFENADSIEHILLAGIEQIDDYAFHSADKLCCVEVTNTTTSLGIYIFADCDSIVEFEFYDGIIRGETDAIDGRASPLKPKVDILNKSSSFNNLLVA